jgi:hypothetical protein
MRRGDARALRRRLPLRKFTVRRAIMEQRQKKALSVLSWLLKAFVQAFMSAVIAKLVTWITGYVGSP